MRLAGHDEGLVSVAGEIGNEGDRRIVLTENPPAVGLLGSR